jgi:hypothetical protein
MLHKLLHYGNPYLMLHVAHPAHFLFWSAVVLVGGGMILWTIRSFAMGTDSKG